MGLDLIVEACSKPGHEAEWQQAIERVFADHQITDAEIARFQEISIPAFARVDAPRVGFDEAANEWIIATRKAVTPEEVSTVMADFHGHYALPLVSSDGLPKYTHANLYEGLDETSFRGAFLKDCGSVLPDDLIDGAWEDKMPDKAIRYGEALLAAADKAQSDPIQAAPPAKRGLFSFLAKKPPELPPLEEQLDVVRTAGRWFIFWGERGHPIRAWA